MSSSLLSVLFVWPIVCHGLPSISYISYIRAYIYATKFAQMHRECHFTGMFTSIDQKYSRPSFPICYKFHFVPGLNSSWYHWYFESHKLIISVRKWSPDGRASCICINRRLSVLVNTVQCTVDITVDVLYVQNQFRCVIVNLFVMLCYIKSRYFISRLHHLRTYSPRYIEISGTLSSLVNKDDNEIYNLNI